MKTSGFKIPNGDIKERYQLLAKIASGGMGDVFLCMQRGAVDFSRLVVMKAISERQVQYTEEHSRMFVNEARVVASLNHPHIVKIHDFCMSDESVYIVMEYVEGETLKYIYSACKSRNIVIPAELSFRLILDACDALHYAHNSTSPTGEKRKIIHRDIGLHNLMLDSNGYLKIIDFGIAKSSVQTDRTSPGLVKGNPAYMAPDLFTKPSPDHRIDIYALGLCLYELLTQTRAFKFSKKTTVGQIIQEISTKKLVPPSMIMPELPVGIDDVVMKAIEKERDDRYSTVQAFANDLKQVAKSVLTTDYDSKQWFQEAFSDRLRERREFGAKMLRLAERNDQHDTPDVIDQIPSGLVSVNSGTSSSASDNKTSQLVIHPGGLYKLLGALFLFFVACVTVVYLLFFKGSAEEEITQASDNLVVSCTPDGSTLTIDGNKIGTLGNESISLHVEPNQKHKIVLSKPGFQEFTLPFIGPSSGVKQINASLKKIEIEKNTEFESANKDAVEIATETENSSKAEASSSNDQKRRRRSGRSTRRSTSKSTPLNDSKSSLSETSPAPEHTPSSNKRKIPLIDDKKKKIPLVDD